MNKFFAEKKWKVELLLNCISVVRIHCQLSLLIPPSSHDIKIAGKTGHADRT